MRHHIAPLVLLLSLILVEPAFSQDPLLLFGGSDHKTFLGCLNCSKYDSGSVCNKYGTHGSKYNSDAIWNSYGTYGSKYSNESPWNQYANNGPVIVDNSGNFYGRLSSNKYAAERTRIQALNKIADLVANGLELEAARDLFCGE